MDTLGLGRTVNELLVLGTLRGGAKHGYQIALDVEEESGGTFELQHGTLYPILHRLERDGLVRGRWTGGGGEGSGGGGRRRKEYALTAAGRRHLGEEAGRLSRAFERLWTMIGEEGHGAVRPDPAAG